MSAPISLSLRTTSSLPLFEGTPEDFYEKVKKYDTEFENKRKELLKQNRKWRYYASMDNGRASVELLTVDPTHPTFDLEGSNNIVLITTERYRELPMVIKGYGAGADVTAAGVFASGAAALASGAAPFASSAPWSAGDGA